MSSEVKDPEILGLKEDYELNRMRNEGIKTKTEIQHISSINKKNKQDKNDDSNAEGGNVPKIECSSSKPD
jgi:hypothetical protein